MPNCRWALLAAAIGLGPAIAAQAVGPNMNLTKAAGNQSETAVAINPNNSNQIFVVSRNETGGLFAARSSDGGLTWATNLIGRSATPAAGDIPRAYGNASAAWDQFGNLFLAYLSQGSVNANTYVALCFSSDGGASFYAPGGAGAVLLLPLNPPSQPVAGDQPTVAVGPGTAGFPGSVWLTYWTKGGIMVSGAGVSGPGAIGAFQNFQPAQPAGVNFGDIAVGPKGEVMIAYGPNSGSSETVYTDLKGDGLGPGPFAGFRPVAAVHLGGFTPIPAQPDWGIDSEAGLAWDRSAGAYQSRVYLVYTDATAAGSTDTNIFVIHSGDGGATWSSPVRVNDDSGANSQFLPHISLDQSSGTIAVTWYDARDSALNNTARYYGAFSGDGGASFGANFAIAAGVSNAAGSTPAPGFKKSDFGDYTGNAFVNGRLVPAWADNSNSTGDNPEGAANFDVYAAVVPAPAAAGQKPKIQNGGVISASAFGAQAGIAAGTWIEIYGANLAGSARDWTALDFNANTAPSSLDGVEVTVNGKAAAIGHISPGQVNAQVPDGIGLGAVPVIVIERGVSSDPVAVEARAVLPGLLSPPAFAAGGKQYAAALAADGKTFVGLPSGLAGGRPARVGEVITLYGIGFGPVTPPVAAGAIATAPNQLVSSLQISFDQSPVDLAASNSYAGLAPGAVGLYQINLTVPNVADGDHQIRVAVNGVALSQSLFLTTGN